MKIHLKDANDISRTIYRVHALRETQSNIELGILGLCEKKGEVLFVFEFLETDLH